MSKCLVIEDGILIQDIKEEYLWDGLFSRVSKKGEIIKFIMENMPKNMIIVIPRSDGNIKPKHKINEYKDIEWVEIQQYLNLAKEKQKIFVLGILSNVKDEKQDNEINYLYMPLDDIIFNNGIDYYFSDKFNIGWKNKSSELFWRGGCSGIGGNNSIRVKFVKKIKELYPKNNNVFLTIWWSENKNISKELISKRVYYIDFFKYKYFFIVDGNVIASNHMWGFASGSVPFIISNATHWFSLLIEPYIHYIPIKYDLSDLKEQIEFIKNNDDIAEKISRNAKSFSKNIFSSEFQKEYLYKKMYCFSIINI